MDRFLFTVDGLDAPLRVVRFAGQEGVSELFRFEITAASSEPAIEIDAVLGKPAHLTMFAGSAAPRLAHGVVARFEHGDQGKKLTTYRFTVVPKVERLEHRRDHRIFQQKTVPDIVKAVLGGAGIDAYRLFLQGSYPVRDHCVQYRETDWAFLSRLLEDEGIHYFFEHGESGHVLVIADAPGAHPAIPGDPKLPYREPTGALVPGEHVFGLQMAGEVRTGTFETRDYSFLKPATALEGSAGGSADTDLPIYDYMGADTEHDPAARAAARVEERRVFTRTAGASSTTPRMTPGHTFTLSDHPRDALDQEYLITRVEHRGIEPAMGEVASPDDDVRYEGFFEAIPSQVPFRPPLVTPRPSIRGLQTATVVGPPGEEIHTDEHGRVKVQFHWDRLGKNDDKSSCWLRVGQAWAGPAYGAMALPRVGHEVLVAFLEGDVDRPIVVGSVYHGTNTPPYKLPDEKTKSTFKTSTTPGGKGFNELRFEDKSGSEEVFLHAQKDLVTDVVHDETRTVGNDQAITIKHDQKLAVENNRTVTVKVDQSVSVDGNESLAVKKQRTVTVTEDESHRTDKSYKREVGADDTLAIKGNRALSANHVTVEAKGDGTVDVAGKSAVTIGGDSTLDVSGALTETVGGDATSDVGLVHTLKAGKKLVIECGSTTVTIESGGDITIEGKSFTVKPTSSATIDAGSSAEVKSGGSMDVKAGGALTIKGASVKIN